ncbi:MAG TPA: methylated-DNA--[protein]-cysteine S-methyltransferase [Acidimicrobiia bacterium]|nr:methylated-DNA--[protein]-cysteine S-methyltransferase [Acidimicrobiia bacterium]
MRWWRQPTPIGELLVVVGDGAIARIALPSADGHEPDVPPERDARVAAAVDAWFDGDAGPLHDAPLDLSAVGSPFRRHVLETLRRDVPWGETVTYGELAEMAGTPGAARAVGTTMARNPVPLAVPCHRVIASGGRIGGYGGGMHGIATKRALLALEGVHLA